MTPPDTLAQALKTAERYTDRKPSEAQKDSGNYAKGKFSWHGETISVENPKGSTRSGTDKGGKRWEVKLPATYGYILGTEAIDKDHVDCYVGDDHASKKVWVIDQVDASTKRYDEPKAMLSFPSREKALSVYNQAFSDGRGPDRIGSVTEMSIPEFRAWANSSAAKKPLGKGYASGGSVMPLIKSGSKAAIASNIKEMSKTRPREQAIAAALDTARRYARASGGRAPGYGDGGMTVGDVTEDVARLPLPKGRDLTTADMDLNEASRLPPPRHDGVAGFLNWLAGDAPSQTRAERAKAQAQRVMDLPRDDFLMESVPGMAAQAALPALARVPKSVMVPTLAGLGASLIGSDAGEAADKGKKGPAVPTADTLPKLPGTSVEGKLPSAVANDPTVKLLLEQYREQRAIADSPVRPDMSKATREGAIKQAAALQEKLTNRIAELTKASQPWAQAHPGWAANWPIVQLAAPALAAYATKNTGEFATRVVNAPWNKAVKRAEESLFPEQSTLSRWLGRPPPPRDFERAAYETAKAQEHLKGQWPAPVRHGLEFARDTGLPIAAGITAGAEASLFPEQFNRRNAPEGSPEQVNATKRLEEEFWKTAAPGMGLGFLGGLGGSHLFPTIGTGRNPAAETRALQRLMGMSDETSGPAPPGLPRGPVPLAPTPLPKSGPGRPGPRGPSEDLPLMDQSIVDVGRPGLVERLPGYRDAVSQLPAPVVRPNLSAPKSASPAPDPSNTVIVDAHGARYPGGHPEGRGGKFATPDPDAKVMTRAQWNKLKREADKASKKDTAQSSTKGKGNEPETEGGGFKAGGAIARALDMARRYASGGAVRVGPMVGATGGRADKLPVSVPAGSYIIPANEVAALGDGNTGAGFKKLEQMFGKPSKQAGHAPVGIKISDGEYILSPEQVAQIGHGSLEKGHATLDAFVKKIRADHIRTLSSLPNPAR